MSDTPRTDAAVFIYDDFGSEVVPADFARTLERELAEARAERDARRQSLAQEIDGCLKARGFQSPGTAVPADLIPAVGRALDAQAAYAGQLREALKEISKTRGCTVRSFEEIRDEMAERLRVAARGAFTVSEKNLFNEAAELIETLDRFISDEEAPK